MALHIWNCSLWNASHIHNVIHLLPTVGWVASATLVGIFPKNAWSIVYELCLMPGGSKILIVLYIEFGDWII